MSTEKRPRLEVVLTETREVVRVIPLTNTTPAHVERAMSGLLRNLHADFHVVERDTE